MADIFHEFPIQVPADRVFEVVSTPEGLDRWWADWNGSHVIFELAPHEIGTWVRFQHLGWPDANEHYRVSNFCWAMYLRLLRRYLEHDDVVPYDQRLEV